MEDEQQVLSCVMLVALVGEVLTAVTKDNAICWRGLWKSLRPVSLLARPELKWRKAVRGHLVFRGHLG